MERENDCQCSSCKYIKAGLRFRPSDQEILTHYLEPKIKKMPLPCKHVILDTMVYDHHSMPWDILKDDDPRWITDCDDSSNKKKIKKTVYVFTELKKRRKQGIRKSGGGTWKGQNRVHVKNNQGKVIGYNMFLTFYRDNQKNYKDNEGEDEDEDEDQWTMHEYSLSDNDSYVLCKITKEVVLSHTDHKDSVDVSVGVNSNPHVDDTLIVFDDDEGQLGDDDQPILDEIGADLERIGGIDLSKDLGSDDDQDHSPASAVINELTTNDQVSISDGQLDSCVGLNRQVSNDSLDVPNFVAATTFHEESPVQFSDISSFNSDISDDFLDFVGDDEAGDEDILDYLDNVFNSWLMGLAAKQ